MAGQTPSGHSRAASLPLWSLGSAVVLVIAGLIFLAVADLDEKSTPIAVTLIALIATTVPSLIGSAFAERTAKDMRNGTVVEKVKEALDDTGVTAAVENANSTTPQTLTALATQTHALNLLLTERLAAENAKLGKDTETT